MDFLEQADDARDLKQFDKAVDLYKKAMNTPIAAIDDYENIRVVEVSLMNLTRLYAEHQKVAEISEMLETLPRIFNSIPKAKTAKIIRRMFNFAGQAGMALEEQRKVCNSMIEWARQEKRSFLRHRLQTRLALILFHLEQFVQSVTVITNLLREVRRLDDKALLVEIHLLESRVQYSLRNPSKARAGLVAARTNANAIYCPPLLQAELDMQSGVLHMDEKDAKTAYSYFYEAFEGYHSLSDHPDEAVRALKYMLLCKVVSGTSEDLNAVLSAKSVLKYHSRVVDSMKAISMAFKNDDTQEFKAVCQQYHDVLGADPVVDLYLKDLYDSLLEHHLTKITEPYSVVQIAYVASLVKLDAAEVEAKLSQMILDKKMNAILDQKYECLVMQVQAEDYAAAEDAHGTIENLGSVVDALFDKVNGKIVPPPDPTLPKKKDSSNNKDGDVKSPTKKSSAGDKKSE
eukprot:PhM_4_TR3180/c0_g1_i1/m.58968/K03036/PSMD11, RPN6; 26S proteasome regulatory subunit N6